MKIERFKNVWDALESDPAERERLKMRSQLMDALRERIDGRKVTQREAAKRLEITQPRLNDLLKGRFNKFSLGRCSTWRPEPGSRSSSRSTMRARRPKRRRPPRTIPRHARPCRQSLCRADAFPRQAHRVWSGAWAAYHPKGVGLWRG